MSVFAAFHVAPSLEAMDEITRSCTAIHADHDYLQLLDILFQSATLQEPAARKIVLTDDATYLGPLANRVRVVRSPVDPDRVMFSRLLAQIDFLDRAGEGEDTIFVDSDMIINASLRSLFAEDFDVALTYRNNPEMPINGGVIVVKGGRGAAAATFLRQVCDSYANKFFDKAAWWGDQLALIDVLGKDRYQRRTADVLSVGGVKIRLLPCEQYNFSPENEFRAIAKPFADKAILHFKGERKRLMPLYWDAHLANRREFGWQTMWHAYRTRRQLRNAA